MDVTKWSSWRSRTIHFGRKNKYEFEPLASSVAVDADHNDDDAAGKSKYRLSKWKVMWRKLRREKKRMVEMTTLVLSRNYNHDKPLQLQAYDEYTYTQNFDQGSSSFWDDEPDILSRSFSVRFSDPSKSYFPEK